MCIRTFSIRQALFSISFTFLIRLNSIQNFEQSFLPSKTAIDPNPVTYLSSTLNFGLSVIGIGSSKKRMSLLIAFDACSTSSFIVLSSLKLPRKNIFKIPRKQFHRSEIHLSIHYGIWTYQRRNRLQNIALFAPEISQLSPLCDDHNMVYQNN